jgi:hypothetical protein
MWRFFHLEYVRTQGARRHRSVCLDAAAWLRVVRLLGELPLMVQGQATREAVRVEPARHRHRQITLTAKETRSGGTSRRPR